MRQEMINIYTFEELSEKVQEKVIEKNRYINVEYWEWYHSVYNQWEEKLKAMGFENPEINFTMSYSQGDGASFTADVNLEKIVNTLVMCKSNRAESTFYLAFEKMQYYGLIDLEIDIIRDHYSRYYHENTCSVRIDYNTFIDNISNIADTVFSDHIEQLENDIECLRHNLCQELYLALENEYDWLTCDEHIKEILICNEYGYTIDGKEYY